MTLKELTKLFNKQKYSFKCYKTHKNFWKSGQNYRKEYYYMGSPEQVKQCLQEQLQNNLELILLL